MEVSGDIPYEFDEENSLLYAKDDDSSVKVKFKGNAMIWTADDGDEVTLNRLD
jgi:GH18 family chitinase